MPFSMAITMMSAERMERILARLGGRSQVEAFEAAKAIWENLNEPMELPLIKLLKTGRRPFNRAAAACAMQILTTPRTIKALENTVKSISENGRVRGAAAEALAHGHRKQSHDVLLKCLSDSSKDVRFWCAFALGEMAEKRALPRLTLVAASDKRIVKSFWSVSKEATDAIENIQQKKIPHPRKNGCVYCVRP